MKRAAAGHRRKTTTHEAELAPANRELLSIVEEWARHPMPPQYDAAFWRQFERDLKHNRIVLRRPI